MSEEYRNPSPGRPERSGGAGGETTGRTGAGGGRSGTGKSRTGGRGGNGRGRSGRRRRRSLAARISGALLYVLLVIGVSAILATMGWIWAGDVLALNKEPASAVITLPADIFTETEVEVETTDENGVTSISKETVSRVDMDYVADLLEREGLIEYKFLFKLFAKFTHSEDDVAAGTYELNTDMDYRALLLNISRRSATRQVVKVTIPEGYTIDQLFALLEENGVSTVEELQNMAATYDYKFTWLQGVIPLGDYHRLEGYLFPDTYDFYAGEDPKYVLNKMLANFERKMEGYFDTIAEQGRTLAEIVNIAAMIEKETDGEDQATIASVIYNRLERPSDETVGYLQICATLVYINGGNIPTNADKAIDSPYNTYMYKGLPAGPISNPGMVALYAAMNPESTNYYFYVVNPSTGHHGFSRTYAEHIAKANEYGNDAEVF